VSGAETTNTCGAPSTKPKPGTALSFTWEMGYNGDCILITDADCAAKYPNDKGSSDLYCRNTYRKQ
jgi:hypothetical protein